MMAYNIRYNTWLVVALLFLLRDAPKSAASAAAPKISILSSTRELVTNGSFISIVLVLLIFAVETVGNCEGTQSRDDETEGVDRFPRGETRKSPPRLHREPTLHDSALARSRAVNPWVR